MVLEESWSRIIGLGIRQLKLSKKRRNLAGFPLKLERFWPWLIAYSLCLLSLYCLCFGSCLMKKNTIII